MKNKKANIILCAALIALSVPYASATRPFEVSGTGSDSPVFKLEVYDENETYIDPSTSEHESTYTLESASIEAIKAATQNWIDVLSIGTLDSPIKIAVYTSDRYNASAMSPNYISDENYWYKYITFLLLGLSKSDDKEEGIIEIGKGVLLDGWDTNPVNSSLYKGGTLPSLYSTMSHELMHALGVSSLRDEYDDGFFFLPAYRNCVRFVDKALSMFAGGEFN